MDRGMNWGMGEMSNKNAGVADSVANKTQGAPATAGVWAVSAEADDFSEHLGGIQWCWPPGLGEKSPPIPQGKQRASSGGYPRGAPLGSLLHPFLERKGCARPGMRGRHPATAGRAVPAAKPRCGAMGNLVACVAAVLQIKPRARSSRPGRGPATAGGYRG